MSNSISGNCGIPFANVALGSVTPASTFVVADASGNYTFTGLAAGIYIVFPQLYGYGFSPSGQLVTIAAANITGINFTATASPTPLGIWQKQGQLTLPALSGQGPGEPSVLYEGNAQILSGNVFKMWYLGGGYTTGGIYYAESADGITWTASGSNPIIASATSGRVFKNGSTYHGFYAVSFHTINHYTSTDGVAWTLANANVVVRGSTGAWDDSQIYNMQVVDFVGGVWRAVYGGNRANGILCTGLLTSPDLVTWTKSSSNPVAINFSSTNVVKVGATYFAWGDVTQYGRQSATPGNLEFPTIFGRTSSTDLITWTTPVQSLAPTALWESTGPNASGTFQIDSPAVLEVNGKTYMFYWGGPGLSSGSQTGSMGLAIANGPLSAVVGVAAEGVIGPGISLVQENHSYAFGTSPLAMAYKSNVTKGNLLLAWLEGASTGASVSDTLANDWFEVCGFTQNGGFGGVQLWACWTTSSGANTVTFPSGSFMTGQISEFSGGLIGTFGTFNASGSGVTPGETVLGQVGSMIFAACVVAGSASLKPGTGWTPTDGNSSAGGYTSIFTIPSAAGSSNPNWTMAPTGSWGLVGIILGGTLPAFPLGNPDNTALPYLGCVAVEGSDPGGGYAGHVRVITAARAGAANPYLGRIFVSTAPVGAADNFLGEVTVVAGPPDGNTNQDIYLAHIAEE